MAALWTTAIVVGCLSLAHGDVMLPNADPGAPLAISASSASHFRSGAYDVWLLSGGCELRQGEMLARSAEAALWVERVGLNGPEKVIAYLEGEVVIDHARAGPAHPESGQPSQRMTGPSWLGRFATTAGVWVRTPPPGGEPEVKPPLYHRAMAARDPGPALPKPWLPSGALEAEAPPTQASYRVGPATPTPRVAQALPLVGPAPPAAGPRITGVRRVRLFPRSSVGVQIRWFPSEDQTEQIGIIKGGVSVLIEGLEVEGLERLGEPARAALGDLGLIELAADSVVIWTPASATADLFSGALQAEEIPLELYLDGNIVFRQGDRVVYADRMYYNVNQRQGVVLDAEIITPVPEYQGLVRLKADALAQVSQNEFVAYGAAVTTSRLAVPRYWLQSDTLTFSDYQAPLVDPLTGAPAINPVTGEPAVRHDLRVTSENNFLYALGSPIFYWPTIVTDLAKPTFYLDSLRLRNDSIFGVQFLADWDLYHLLGADPAPGTEWTLSTDYLSKRGPALGTTFRYDRQILYGDVASRQRGLFDAWGIYDTGLDNLGRDRRALVPEADFRGRVLWNHLQTYDNGWQVSAELGVISDRNFLEQYFEQEWDEGKDQTTGAQLKRIFNNQELAISADVRVNDFFTQTEWLPRLDHYILGERLLFDALTWHAHSHVGYARLRTATPPENPLDAPWTPLPWETDLMGNRFGTREGVVAATRHELGAPFDLGPVRVVPYVLGEAAHWGEDRAGDDLTRLYGQAGVRSSLAMWRSDRDVHSDLFYLNGLTHKVTLRSDVFFGESNADLDLLPLYHPLDDDSQEHFRRRFATNTFGGVVPPQFDERNYAFRSGMQSWVATDATEIADDLAVARLAIEQRWQTKRGLPGQERIVDWIVFNVGASVFPKADRDNFGEEIGLAAYDFRWHVGDRVTIFSDGLADVFPDGLRTFSVGGALTRPATSEYYLGIRTIEGPISSNIVTASMRYRMSEKWIFDTSTSVDLNDTENLGQTFGVTRLGESALLRVGLNVDQGRDNVGLQIAIEPRFLPSGKLSLLGGERIPPAGALKFE